MILKRNSLLFRIAYWGTPRYMIPHTTSLCNVFWRCVLKGGVTVFIAGVGIACAIVLILQNPWEFLKGLGVGLSVLAGMLALGFGLSVIMELPKQLAVWEHNGELSPFVLGALAVKRKFCPIVKIED